MLASVASGIARRSPVSRAAATGPVRSPTAAMIRRVRSSRSRASAIRQDAAAGLAVIFTAPRAKPTPPIRSNHALRAKSKPPGSDGAGGGRTIASAETRSPGIGTMEADRTEMRMRCGISPIFRRSIATSSRVSRIPFSVGSTLRTRPDSHTGPISRMNTGPDTMAVRNCAAPKPNAAIVRASAVTNRTPRRRRRTRAHFL